MHIDYDCIFFVENMLVLILELFSLLKKIPNKSAVFLAIILISFYFKTQRYLKDAERMLSLNGIVY